MGYSWGSFESLATPRQNSKKNRKSALEKIKKYHKSNSTSGLEDPKDLILNLNSAFQRL
jgi:Cystathionine beta-lyases/cystathionine gamma-synthases